MKRSGLLAFAIVLILALGAVTMGTAEGKVHLVMVESLTSPQRTEVLQSIIDRFQAENPNITIELISPPLEGADQKIRQMLMNQNDIDIMEVRDWTSLEFSQNGYLLALDDYIAKWDGAATLVENFRLTGTRAGGKYYLMPYGFYQSMLFYRSDWFAEAGLALPTTYDELLDVCVKITDPAKGRYGWTLRGISGGASLVSNITIAKLGRDGVVNDDTPFLPDGRTIYATPEAVEAFKMVKRFYEEASPKDAISWGYPDQCQAFTSGVTAVLQQDPEVVAICEELMQPGTWSTMPLVVDAKTQNANFNIGYAGWGISSFCKHPDEAFKFLSFLENSENNAIFCEKYSVIPIHSDAATRSEFFSSGPFGAYTIMNSKPENYFITSGPEKYAENTEFSTLSDSDFQNVLQGNAAIEDTLASWNAFWLAAKANQ